MNLNESDIKAIAKARVNDAEGRKQLYWLGAVMVMTVAGVYLTQYNKMAWGLLVGAIFALWWYTNELTKRQVQLYKKLLSEYNKEQENEK
jgi:Flp pilus assembly protein TadB